MRRRTYDMGRIDWIGSESVGVPGQRTFRLAVYNRTMSAHLWLEKEELQALTQAIAQMLLEINTERGLADPDARPERRQPQACRLSAHS